MKKRKVKRYVLIGTITIVLGTLSFIMYQSYAYFKVNYTGNIINTIVGPFGSYEYAYTGTAQEFIVPTTGYYEIELWGAQGGSINAFTGGKGGYTKGTIYLTKNENLYVYVGISGANNTGWNGGGIHNANQPVVYGSAGGGATDIRLIRASVTNNTIWNENASLRSRIMVAGGGGGANNRGEGYGDGNGGVGGNLIGGKGFVVNNTNGYGYAYGSGGSQTIGGYYNSVPGTGNTGATVLSGSFGKGGDNTGGHSAGGGGYYGGGHSGHSGSGGGSSYISGYAGTNGVQETGGTTSQPLHTDSPIHYSGKYFQNNTMKAGINTGNGKAIITYVGQTMPTRNTVYDDIRYVQACQRSAPDGSYSWVELQIIANGENVSRKSGVTVSLSPYYAPYTGTYERLIDGITASASYVANYGPGAVNSLEQCLTVDLKQAYGLDEIALWHYWADSRSYYGVSIRTSINNTTWQSAYDYNVSGRYTETEVGKRVSAWD